MAQDKYSICESYAATPHSLWHIRKLSERGHKYGGGIDTPGLCGWPNERSGGWDLEVPMTEFHMEHNICKKCVKAYREATAEQESK